MTTLASVDICIGEWTSRHVPDVHLTDVDRIVTDRLNESRQLEILDMRDGLRLRSRGYIGVVRLENCTIRVEPTLIDGHKNLIRLLDYVRHVELIKRLSPAATFEAEGTALFDLMAWLMVSACDEVLRIGMRADYVMQHDDLTVLRGRLDLKVQVLQRWGRLDRLVCDYEDRVRDIPENRWLLRALRVARRGVGSERIGSLVSRMTSTWEDLCEDDTAEEIEKPVLNRTNQHYRHALELAYLLIGGVTASDVLRQGGIQGFSFFMSMPRLFEEFVSAALEQVMSKGNVMVERQRSLGSILWDAEEHRSFGQVRPDLMLTSPSGSTCLPVDAKYKNYDQEKLSSGDVYQAAIYALTLSRGRPPRRCLLLYPAGVVRRRQRMQVRVDSNALAEVEAVGLSVPSLLDELCRGCDGIETRTLVDTILQIG